MGLHPAQNIQFAEKEEKCSVKDSGTGKTGRYSLKLGAQGSKRNLKTEYYFFNVEKYRDHRVKGSQVRNIS